MSYSLQTYGVINPKFNQLSLKSNDTKMITNPANDQSKYITIQSYFEIIRWIDNCRVKS